MFIHRGDVCHSTIAAHVYCYASPLLTIHNKYNRQTPHHINESRVYCPDSVVPNKLHSCSLTFVLAVTIDSYQACSTYCCTELAGIYQTVNIAWSPVLVDDVYGFHTVTDGIPITGCPLRVINSGLPMTGSHIRTAHHSIVMESTLRCMAPIKNIYSTNSPIGEYNHDDLLGIGVSRLDKQLVHLHWVPTSQSLPLCFFFVQIKLLFNSYYAC